MANSQSEKIITIVRKLKESPLGKQLLIKLVNRIRIKNKGQLNRNSKQSVAELLLSVISIGNISITDISIERIINIDKQRINYIEKSKIILNKSLSLSQQVTDLAHELTHFLFRKQVNPYKPIDYAKYVNTLISARGGEAEAFVNECQVSYDLFSFKYISRNQCRFFVKHLKNNKISFNKKEIIKDFYKLGKFYNNFVSLVDQKMDFFELKKRLPYLSKSAEIFISSDRQTPYPLALLEQFNQTKINVCNINKKRINILKKSISLSTRRPSSVILKLEMQYRRNCI